MTAQMKDNVEMQNRGCSHTKANHVKWAKGNSTRYIYESEHA